MVSPLSYYVGGCKTEVLHPLRLINQVPALASVKAGMSPVSVSSHSGEASVELLYTVYVSDNRHIRVFLTYTNDSKQHMKEVLRLCDCLKKNNFSVGLDARESHLLHEDGEMIRWHEMRYDKVT